MSRLASALLVPLLCLPAIASAGDCKSLANARPVPPASEGLYPLRILRTAAGPAASGERQAMFEGTRNNDGPVARAIFAAPVGDPMLQMRTRVPLKPGAQSLEVVELIPDSALSGPAAKDRRWSGKARAKRLLIDVVPGQEYALAASLIPATAHRTRGNLHWEPVVWKQEALACR